MTAKHTPDKIKCSSCGISIPDVPEDATEDELLCNACYEAKETHMTAKPSPAGHTPSWEYDYLTSQTGENNIGYVIYTPDDPIAGYPINKEIAKVLFRRTGAKRGESPKYHELPEHKTNARLIAAAPELLAACEALHSCHRAFSSNENWTTLDDEARAQVESIIRKARGE